MSNLLFAVRYQRDMLFVALLLALNAAVFSVFRPNPFQSVALGWVTFAFALVLAVIWLKKPLSQEHSESCDSSFSARDGFALLFLGIVTGAIYFPLMQMHLDTGTDLSVAFGVDELWFQPWADINRPLVGIGPLVAMWLTPDDLDGFVVVVLFCRFATAALLFGTIRIVAPSLWNASLVAGLLYVLNPAELSRFNLWSIYYVVALLFFTAAVFTLAASYRFHSRSLLVISCILLGLSFLQYEHGFPLALVVPLFLLALRLRRHFVVWLLAWYGTVAIFAIRLVTYLLSGAQVYQRALFSLWSEPPKTLPDWAELLAGNLITQTAPLLRMLPDFRATIAHGSISLAVFAGCLSALWFLVAPSSGRLRQLVRLAAIGLLISVLGIIIYVPLPVTSKVPDYATNPTMRYQFFAGLGQATFWSAALLMLVEFVRRAIPARPLLVVMVAALCAAITADATKYQQSGGALNPHYRYETASSVLRQIDAVMPTHEPGDQIFLELSDADRSPIGWDYTAFHWSCRLFGLPMTQGRMLAPGIFETRIFTYSNAMHRAGPVCRRTHYFQVKESGEVRFVGTIEKPAGVEINCPPCVLKPYPRPNGSDLPFVSHPSAR